MLSTTRSGAPSPREVKEVDEKHSISIRSVVNDFL